MPYTWEDVTNTEEYKNSTPEDKEKTHQGYWNRIALPALRATGAGAEEISAEKKKFDEAFYPSLGEYTADRFKRGMGNMYQLIPMASGSDFDAAKAFGYEGLPHPSPNARLLGGPAEFAGESIGALPFTILGGQGLKVAPAAAVEAVSAISGGLGSEWLGEAFEDRKSGEFWGSLLGVTVAGTGGLGLNAMLLANRGFKARKTIWDEMTRQRIGKLLQTDNDEYLKNVQEARAISDRLNNEEGLGFNLAQASDAPGIKNLLAIYEGHDPERMVKGIQKRKETETRIEAAQERLFPGSGLSVEEATKNIQKQRLGGIDERLDMVEQERGALAALYDRDTTKSPEAIGDALRKRKIAREEIARNKFSQEYNGLYMVADQDGVSVDVSDISDWLRNLYKQDETYFQKPDLSPSIKRAYATFGKSVEPELPPATHIGAFLERQQQKNAAQEAATTSSFQKFHSLWNLVNEEYRAMRRAGGQGVDYAIVSHLRTMMREHIDKLEASGTEVGNMFKDINARYKSEYIDIFKKGSGGKITQENKFGYTTKAEDIVNTIFFREDKTAALDDFLRIYGDDPQAIGLLEAGVMDKFAKEAFSDQVIDPNKVNTFMKKYRLLLDKMPGVKAKLMDAQGRNSALVDRANSIRAERDVLIQDKLSKVIDSKDVPGVMRYLLSDDGMIHFDRYAAMAINGGAGRDFAHMVARTISERPDRFEFLMKNEKKFRPVMERIKRGHWQNLKDIVRAWDIADRVRKVESAHIDVTTDPGQKHLGVSLDSLFSRVRAAQEGRSSIAQMYAHIAGKWLTKFGRDTLFEATERAMFDPDLAGTLARVLKASPLEKSNPSLEKAYLFHITNAGIRSGGQLLEPEDAPQLEPPKQERFELPVMP